MGFEAPARRDALLPFAAFDLRDDPEEAQDLVPTSAAWPRSLLERTLPAVQEFSTPRYGSQAAPVDPERAAQLEALGYGGYGRGG